MSNQQDKSLRRVRLLITGGEGVVGRRLALLALAASIEVFTVDRVQDRPITQSRPESLRLALEANPFPRRHILADITYPETLRRAFEIANPSHVFHLAASVGRDASEAYAPVAIRANVEAVQSVVDLCLEWDCRLLYVSSSEAYGDAFASREYVDEETPVGTHLGIYGLSKYMGEQVVRLAEARRGLDAAIARPFMFYSDEEPLTRYRSAVARFMKSVLAGEPLTVHRGAIRSWCFVDDGARGLLDLGLSPATGVYNVGRDDPLSIREAALLLCEMTQHVPGVEVVDPPDNIYSVKLARFDRIREAVGFEATITLREGFRRLIPAHLPLYDRFKPR